MLCWCSKQLAAAGGSSKITPALLATLECQLCPKVPAAIKGETAVSLGCLLLAEQTLLWALLPDFHICGVPCGPGCVWSLVVAGADG